MFRQSISILLPLLLIGGAPIAAFGVEGVGESWEDILPVLEPSDSLLLPLADPPLSDRWIDEGQSLRREPQPRWWGGAGGRSERSEGPVQIPEPLLFDMVRPLGPNRGDFEINTLAIFPWRARSSDLSDDPFGPGPTTIDRRGIEWAPEIEIALSDRFAIEFELPFEGGVLEELKVGLQWTIGTAFDNRYIHGFQALIEPTPQFETWNSTLLYIGGIRFDETWSTLFMIGGRMDLEGPENVDTFERLINASLFAEVNDWLTLGLETNTAIRLDGSGNFILLPQAHIDLTDCIEIQSGIGLGAASEGYELSGILRVIYAP